MGKTDPFFSDKSSTCDRPSTKRDLVINDQKTSSFNNSAAESGTSIITVIEKAQQHQPIAQSEADLTKITKSSSASRKKHSKKRGSSANSISSISKSGSTSRSRSNASRTVTMSSHNCSSHTSCSYSSSACSGSFSSSYSSSTSSSSISLSQEKVGETLESTTCNVTNIPEESQEIICSMTSPNAQGELENSEGDANDKTMTNDPADTETSTENKINNQTTPDQGNNSINDDAKRQESLDDHQSMNKDDNDEKTKPAEYCCSCCKCCASHCPPEMVFLVSPGSFNPVTMMHMRMLELSRDAIERTWEVDTIQDGKLVRRSSLHRLPKRIKDHEPESSTLDNNNEDGTPSVILPRRQMVAGGIFSPVSDAYKKAGLEAATNRRRLLRLACASTSDWLAVDDWESQQATWTPTRQVLEYFQQRIDSIVKEAWLKRIHRDFSNSPPANEDVNVESMDVEEVSTPTNGMPGIATDKWIKSRISEGLEKHYKWATLTSGINNENGRKISTCNCFCNKSKMQPSQSDDCQMDSSDEPRETCTNPIIDQLPKVRVKLVGGGDFLESMGKPGLWSDDDVNTILSEFGLVCICRTDTDPVNFIRNSKLSKYEQNIIFASELYQNGLSATVVRRALSKGLSARYLVPDAALDEIYAAGLYGANNNTTKDFVHDIDELTRVLNKPLVANGNLFNMDETNASSVFINNNGAANNNIIDLRHIKDRQEILLRSDSIGSNNICIPLTIQIGQTEVSSLVNNHVKMKSRSVQTRLTALPLQQAPLVLTRMPNENDENIRPIESDFIRAAKNIGDEEDFDEKTILKHVDQNSQHHVSAILPLVRQCHKCGSQKVRLILVERPTHLSNVVNDQRHHQHNWSQSRVETVNMEQQAGPVMQPASVQTDRMSLKKCSNKKTQYPSLRTKKSQILEVDADSTNKLETLLVNEVIEEKVPQSTSPPILPVRNEETVIPRDFKSRRPPPPIPKCKSPEIAAEIEIQPGSSSLESKEPPRQETLNTLISPASIYALISDQHVACKSRSPIETLNVIPDEDVEDGDEEILAKIPSSSVEKGKLCKHKRHHFHTKRENTVQSSDVGDTRYNAREDLMSPSESHHHQYNQKCSRHAEPRTPNSRPTSRGNSHHSHNCSIVGHQNSNHGPHQNYHHQHHHESHRHRQNHKHLEQQVKPLDDEEQTSAGRYDTRQSRTLPKSSRSQILPMEDVNSTQNTIKKILDNTTVISHGRGRSLPSVSLRSSNKDIGNELITRQTTLTDDSFGELMLRDPGEMQMFKSLETPTRQSHQHFRKSHKHHHHHHHHNNQACLAGEEIGQQKLFDSMVKGANNKHSADCQRNPDYSELRTEKKSHNKHKHSQSQWMATSAKMTSTGRESSLAGLDSDFSFPCEKDNDAFTKYTYEKVKRRRTPERSSLQNMIPLEVMNTYKCSRHQAQSQKSKKIQDENAVIDELQRRQEKLKQSVVSSKSSKKSSSRAKL